MQAKFKVRVVELGRFNAKTRCYEEIERKVYDPLDTSWRDAEDESEGKVMLTQKIRWVTCEIGQSDALSLIEEEENKFDDDQQEFEEA